MQKGPAPKIGRGGRAWKEGPGGLRAWRRGVATLELTQWALTRQRSSNCARLQSSEHSDLGDDHVDRCSPGADQVRDQQDQRLCAESTAREERHHGVSLAEGHGPEVDLLRCG